MARLERIGHIPDPPFDGVSVDVWTLGTSVTRVELVPDYGEYIVVKPENVNRLVSLLQQAER